jgi:hypothetical protein
VRHAGSPRAVAGTASSRERYPLSADPSPSSLRAAALVGAAASPRRLRAALPGERAAGGGARTGRTRGQRPRPWQSSGDCPHASGGEPLPIQLSEAAGPSYTAGVTAAYDYEDMHHLVDRLTPTQVRRLRLLVTQDEELSQVAQALPAVDANEAEESVPAGLLALIGSVNGPEDLAERHDDYIRERMRERFGDSA